jgi:uncharacterized lipoprotein YmbA
MEVRAMKKTLITLMVIFLAGCMGSGGLKGLLEDRNSELMYLHDSQKSSEKTVQTLKVESFVVDDVLSSDTAVKRTSAYFVPLLFVNFWKEDFQCTLGSAQIKNDYKEFMRESFIVELKRSSKFEYAAESAEMTLVIRVKKIDMSAPVNTKGNLLIPIYAFFYNRHAMAGPVDVTVYADVILKKGSVELFIRELQGKYRADILKREQNVSMANYLKDFTPAMIDGLSLAIKDLNEKIVKEINQI